MCKVIQQKMWALEIFHTTAYWWHFQTWYTSKYAALWTANICFSRFRSNTRTEADQANQNLHQQDRLHNIDEGKQYHHVPQSCLACTLRNNEQNIAVFAIT